MADFRRGIIAGVAAAVIFFIISVILEVTGLADRLPMSVSAAGLFFLFDLSEPWRMVLQLVPRLVQGVIFGAVFAALYAFLPGRTAVRKAIVVSLMIWVVGVIQSIMYTYPRWPWQSNGMLALISIASAVVLGALAGAIWNRLKARETMESRPGSAALLAGFAIGICLWLGVAVSVMGAVVTGWFWELLSDIPAIRWTGILYASAAILGLVGWILVLLGWRRTRRGEIGFRRGLAGGILMAVTGTMLLPGVVSIIGAVLSRREPAHEAVTISD